MSKSRIDPVQDAFGNVAYRVQRILPTFASAQVAAFAMDEIDPADLEPPPVPEPGSAYPPNCDGLNCAELLTERTAGDD